MSFALPFHVIDDVPGAEVGYRAIIDDDGFIVCERSPMGDATAVLLKSAPELLDALTQLVEYATSGDRYEVRNPYAVPQIKNAIRAIEKATPYWVTEG